MIDELALRIAPVVLANITTRYPYIDSHLMMEGETSHDPFAAHPAFGNSYDWHSSVHSHWTAVHVIERFAENGAEPEKLAALEKAVAANLHADRLDAEKAYLVNRTSYERPYGWAWTMALASAVARARRPAIHACGESLRELAERISANAIAWLSMLPMPIRHGVHSNTAFALRLMHEASQTLGMPELDRAIDDRAREWFADDRDWPAHFERSGSDFLSPGLTEADLMRSVLPPNEFASWWKTFLPGLSNESPILCAVSVPNVDDGHIVHLHGLNLSRAAALARIGRAVAQPQLVRAARTLYAASVGRAASGFYTETHWLPTFAWDAAASLDNSD